MNANDFSWDELLARINGKNVIPVIGQGLYWVCTDENDEVLLYDHLAKKLAQTMGVHPLEHTNHAFSKMVFRYLKEKPNDYLGLQRFLTQNLASLYPIPANPLWKLARLRPFSLFINTTYDHFLEHTLNSVRNYPTEALHHTLREKRTEKVTMERFDMLENFRLSLLFHIYGSAAINQVPSYTEKDILETVVTFQKDMEKEPKNLFFQALKEKSLLFIGCGYEDWLFRFFIRTIANESFQTPRDPLTWKFIADDFDSFDSDDLICFLKAYDSQVYYSRGGKNFVDVLFEKMKRQYPEHIIPEEEFPETAFISFHGADRRAAVRLASHLREDGIKVWLDQRALKPGDRVDETIIKAIDKCPVFIPLISKAAKQLQRKKGMVSYHIREWEWAHSQHVRRNNPREIMPVKIDGTGWMYEPFKGKVFVSIPGGSREGDYEILKNRLLEIQNSTR